MSDSEMITAKSAAPTPPKKFNRKKKLALSPNKVRVRPGGQPTAGPPVFRTLAIKVWPAGQVGTIEEEAQIRALAELLKAHPEVGAVISCGINNGVWQTVMQLGAAAAVTDEDALDDAFEKLVPELDQFALLKTGFGGKKPKWHFNGKESVDSGHF